MEDMELRHLRYFVAVVEEGSLTVAAERRLHTSQPSLSRQIRDLEYEVGEALLTRSVSGVEMTPAGRAFLDHARLALAQVDAAVEAARQAMRPAKMQFALGFLTGQEMDWLPAAMSILRTDLCKIDVKVSSQDSLELAEGLLRGRLDLAFLRRETGFAELTYKTVSQEPLVVILPSDHALASAKEIGVQALADQTFIGVSDTAPSLKRVIVDYLNEAGLGIRPAHVADNLAMAMSLVASTRGVALLPAYAQNFLPWSVTSRPLAGPAPTIDLVIGYNRANTSAVLQSFLSQVDAMIERVSANRPFVERGTVPRDTLAGAASS
jgi:LysR family transcriptional regulator, hca operon transcriptional activator